MVSEDGPSSVPFRASSKLRSQRRASSSRAGYTSWLVLDVDDRSLPFLRTLRRPDVTSSPAARSIDLIPEAPEVATSKARSNTLSSQQPPESSVDKRMSLQQQHPQPPSTGSVNGKKSGFMSRFRGPNHSVTNASVFAPPPSAVAKGQSAHSPLLPTSEWSAASARRTLHFAMTTSTPANSQQAIQNLISRPMSSFAAEAVEWEEQVHNVRLDANGLTELVRELQPEAIYIGSCGQFQPRRDMIEALLRSQDLCIKEIVVEPSAVRSLSPPDATLFYALAQASSVTLSLPVRWDALENTASEETLLVLETLQEARTELVPQTSVQPSRNVDPDVSMDKSFDVSISNIPTGLSGHDLAQVAVDTTALNAQMNKLQQELRRKDEQISGLLLRQPAPIAAEPVTVLADPIAPVPAVLSPVPSVKTSNDNNGNVGAARTLFVSANESPLRSSRFVNVLDPPSPLRSPHSRVGSMPSSPSSKAGSGKVIAALTSELDETKVMLEATRTALQTVKTQAATFQAQADDMRGTLSRARLETDSTISVLARKDRQISEALERARKAETEAKDLGRAGREWGTRVRQVEEELGKERVKCARAEQQYETLSLEWKQARSRLITEVQELRKSHGEQLHIMADEYQKILLFKERLQQEWQLPPTEGEQATQVLGPTTLLTEISALNSKLVAYIEREVQPILTRLLVLEKREDAMIFDKVAYVTDELTRIKTLMRKGTITSPSQIHSASSA